VLISVDKESVPKGVLDRNRNYSVVFVFRVCHLVQHAVTLSSH